MRVSIFGLGYVGCVSLGCLAQDGHTVIGVDLNSQKVDAINRGIPTIVEAKIDKIIADQVTKGRIRATTDHEAAVLETDVSIVCVGTPSTDNGHLNLDAVIDVAGQIGSALARKDTYHTVVIRSTVSPGTNLKVGRTIENASGKKAGVGFGVVSNPEFMREGSGVDDYYDPGIIVLGSEDERSLKVVMELYASIKARVEITDVGVAEFIKYVNNSFHALKIAFANEIGNICKKAGIDSHKVFDVFCRDSKLNISPRYFRPGFAYGGSCLPKDLKALKTLAHDFYLDCSVIESIEKSNDNQKDIAYRMIAATHRKKIGVIGLSFKPGTDDLRYSPAVDLVERLLGKGFAVRIYDPNVFSAKLTGANKSYIDQHIPHLADLVSDDIRNVIGDSDVLVVTHGYAMLSDFHGMLANKIIIDLARIDDTSGLRHYEGICW